MKKLFLPLLLAMFIIGCEQESSVDQVSADYTYENASTPIPKGAKVDVCHKGRIISVNINAIPGHRGHGDAVDMDGDGYFDIENDCGEMDCDDSNVELNPGMEEICGDGIDNNCDGQIDEDCCPTGQWCGTVNQGGFTYNMGVTFNNDCLTATAFYVNLCTVSWTLTSVSGNVSTYTETVTSGSNCVNGCTITIVDNGSTLAYSFTCVGGGSATLSACP